MTMIVVHNIAPTFVDGIDHLSFDPSTLISIDQIITWELTLLCSQVVLDVVQIFKNSH